MLSEHNQGFRATNNQPCNHLKSSVCPPNKRYDLIEVTCGYIVQMYSLYCSHISRFKGWPLSIFYAVKMMIFQVAIFTVCWFPQHLFFLVSNKYSYINHHIHIQHVYLSIYWLAMCNSIYNPFIYCWMNAR